MGMLFALAVLAVVVYLGFKVLPVMVHAYSFRDFMEQEARFAALQQKDETVRKRVLAKARELDLPVNARGIKVKRSRTHFDIQVKYTVPIETPVYTYQWAFEESSRAPLF